MYPTAAFSWATPLQARRSSVPRCAPEPRACASQPLPLRAAPSRMSATPAAGGAPAPAPASASSAPSEAMHVRTPLHESPALSARAGARLLLKMDTQQPAGSFKIRGMGLACARAAARGARRLVCSSGGNAGAAVAHAGAVLRVRATIVVPASTPHFMLARLRAAGAEVVVEGAVWDEADARARAIVADAPAGSAVYVSPFDHPDIWEGHASLVHELADDLAGRPPAAIVVSVGGGGLFLGVAQGCRDVGWDDVPIVAAETAGADSFAAMVRKRRVVALPAITSIAKSLGALAVSERCAEWVREGRAVVPIVVEDVDAVQACVDLAVHHRVLVEPACGAAVAAAVKESGQILGRTTDAEQNGKPVEGSGGGVAADKSDIDVPIVVIVCGGNMASPALLKQWVSATGANADDLV